MPARKRYLERNFVRNSFVTDMISLSARCILYFINWRNRDIYIQKKEMLMGKSENIIQLLLKAGKFWSFPEKKHENYLANYLKNKE